MDFRLTPEQQQFRDSVVAFSQKHLAGGARDEEDAAIVDGPADTDDDKDA